MQVAMGDSARPEYHLAPTRRDTSFRILIYSQDGYGLGHLRRNLNICTQLKKILPDVSILILADSPVAPFFRLPPQCDFIKLPTIVKVDTGVWRPTQLPVKDEELLKIRRDIILNVMQSFRPHVFLVDHMPHGVLGELSRPIETLKRHFPHTRVILGLRDILGAQATIRKMWETEGAFETLESFYDGICIYGSKSIFDLVKEYHFPPKICSMTRYCGYVTRSDRGSRNQSLWQKYGNHEKGKKFILLTGGGGADANFFMEKFIDSAEILNRHIPFHALLCVGPFMPKKQILHLHQRTQGLPVRIVRMLSDSIGLLKRADLVVSMAGYNTVSEIMRYRKNAVIVPRPGPSAEQTMRTTLLAGRGLFNAIHQAQLTTERFSELIYMRLTSPRVMHETQIPNLQGAQNAAGYLTSILAVP